jgi:hypothetical protein
MNSRRKFLSFLVLPVVLGLAMEPALADSGKKKKKRKSSQSNSEECVLPGDCRGYGDFLNDLQNRYPNEQYLDGGNFNDGGREYYWFRMLDPDGQVRDRGVDPETGEWFNLR